MRDRLLFVDNLYALVDSKEILCGISLSLGPGEIHVLMGPNGSGKSTVAHAIMGSPLVTVTSGIIYLQNENITTFCSDDRAKRGLYLAFQHPVEVVGVGMVPFVRSVLASKQMPIAGLDEFKKDIKVALERVGLPDSIIERNLNEGFSGGEKKRNELFQLSIFQPKVAIIDEIDSGLDVDGAQMAARELQEFAGSGGSALVITHMGVMARALNPFSVYIMKGGKITASGGKELVEFVEAHGFESL